VDERLDPDALATVLPVFDDPSVGAVQIAARIEDRDRNLLTRMQDAEMLVHSEVFQRGRQHLGGNGLGCEPQFVRLSAMSSQGDEPWSPGLRPELTLGLRMMASGWRTEFAPACAVHRPPAIGLRAWLTQRSRRMQGTMQCWQLGRELIPSVPGLVVRLRLMLKLSSPVLVLAGSLAGAALVLWSVALAIAVGLGSVSPSWWWLCALLLLFLPAVLFGDVYHEASAERPGAVARWSSVLVMHLYVGYLVWWGVAGWWALLRTLTGRQPRPEPGRAVSSARARHRKQRRGAWARLAAP
jgi:cellulose synthase/poly-beta-1,6-N-acetylglucosamine synthase-like glycosyltransferase